MSRSLFFAQLGTTLPMVGVIWFVQIVAYPLFARVGAAEFSAYHAAHSRLITWIVGPLMLVELVASCAWTLDPSHHVTRGLAVFGAGLTLTTWAVTMFLSVPAHNVLASGFDARAYASLVSTNWLRTVAWTLRGAMLLWALAREG